MNYDELFLNWDKCNWEVCLYGLGHLGQRLWQSIPGMLNIKADMYTDSNRNKVDSVSLPGLHPIYVEDLLKINEDVLVLVLVDDPYDDEIAAKLGINNRLHIVTLRELTRLNFVIRNFYGEDLYKKYLELPYIGSAISHTKI